MLHYSYTTYALILGLIIMNVVATLRLPEISVLLFVAGRLLGTIGEHFLMCYPQVVEYLNRHDQCYSAKMCSFHQFLKL